METENLKKELNKKIKKAHFLAGGATVLIGAGLIAHFAATRSIIGFCATLGYLAFSIDYMPFGTLFEKMVTDKFYKKHPEVIEDKKDTLEFTKEDIKFYGDTEEEKKENEDLFYESLYTPLDLANEEEREKVYAKRKN